GLLNPLYNVVAWILAKFHSFWTFLGMPADGGWTWVLSIVGLVVLIRILLIPLFVKQIKAQRGLQMLQPRIKEIQKRNKDDRQKQSEELMKLYRETGTNPFSSCLPIILQMPIFFALFHVLSNGVQQGKPVGAMTQTLVDSAQQAAIFGAPISAKFMSTQAQLDALVPGTDITSVRIVTLVLIALMTITTFTTQKQLMVKGMPAGQDNPLMQQQKILIYVFPLMFAVFGINFPIGVLFYWLTTNLWSMGQQFYVIRRNPSPGSPAADALEARKAAKAEREAGGGGAATTAVVETDPGPPKPGRAQPKRQSRSQRKGGPRSPNPPVT
ncbi:MAG: membrane protein insertase YidC, partial [Candidatus Nanopelagicales bacterium]